MPQLFLIANNADSPCARQVQDNLELRGYTFWTLPAHYDTDSPTYPTVLERGIRGSASVILIWSAHAAQDAWIERMLLYALQLRRPLVTLTRDETPLPPMVINVPNIRAANCHEVASHLLSLLPPVDTDDFLLALLTHEHTRAQKQGIAEAANRIARGERPEEWLAQLEEMAHNSLFKNIAQEARKALDRFVDSEASPLGPHMFGAQCSKGHVSYFDKREVCPPTNNLSRTTVQRAGKCLEEMLLYCQNPDCDEQLVIHIDCGGYEKPF